MGDDGEVADAGERRHDVIIHGGLGTGAARSGSSERTPIAAKDWVEPPHCRSGWSLDGACLTIADTQRRHLMLKKVLFAALATALVAAVALPVGFSSVEAATITCKEAAKMKFPTSLKQRHAWKKGCVAAWKAANKSAKA
jgi:hypothetical protein